MRRPAILCALGALTLACGTERRRDPTADTAAAQSGAPATSADSASPTDSSADSASASPAAAQADARLVLRSDSAGGDSLYRGKGKCLSCHGPAGAGVPNLGPSLRDSVWLDVDGTMGSIRQVIVDGVASPRSTRVGMPAFATRLSPVEISRLAGYVYSLSHPGAVVIDTTTARVDSAAAGAPGAGSP